jgi:hypothetical protein
VEYGFLSTTTARETAFQYSGVDKKRGIVFEIQAGRVDVGASIQVCCVSFTDFRIFPFTLILEVANERLLAVDDINVSI